MPRPAGHGCTGSSALTCFPLAEGAGPAIAPTSAKSLADDTALLYGATLAKDAIFVRLNAPAGATYGGVAVDPPTASDFLAKVSLEGTVVWAKGAQLPAGTTMVGSGDGFAFATYATTDVAVGGGP